MKNILMPLAIAGLAVVGFSSCQKDVKDVPQEDVSQETLAQIKSLGFSNQNVRKVEEGYLVEGDIVLTDELLNSSPEQQLLRVAGNEQYRTTNLVTKLPRTITILVS